MKADDRMEALQRVEVMDVQVTVIDVPRLLDVIAQRAREPRVTLINNVNVHAMNLAASNEAFRQVLNDSDIVFCDGFGLKAGAWLLGKRLGARMTPPDWIDRLFRRCIEGGLSVYALGDTASQVQTFVDLVRRRFPALNVCGCHHGFFDTDGEANRKVLDDIRASGADIVLIGMGMPRQELWAAAARRQLPKGVLISTGALYRWYTGTQRRSPKWMTDHGLEWFGRLLRDPRRMWRRYVVGNPAFFARVLARKWSERRGAQS